jgi:hypothetical protein
MQCFSSLFLRFTLSFLGIIRRCTIRNSHPCGRVTEIMTAINKKQKRAKKDKVGKVEKYSHTPRFKRDYVDWCHKRQFSPGQHG